MCGYIAIVAQCGASAISEPSAASVIESGLEMIRCKEDHFRKISKDIGALTALYYNCIRSHALLLNLVHYSWAR